MAFVAIPLHRKVRIRRLQRVIDGSEGSLDNVAEANLQEFSNDAIAEGICYYQTNEFHTCIDYLLKAREALSVLERLHHFTREPEKQRQISKTLAEAFLAQENYDEALRHANELLAEGDDPYASVLVAKIHLKLKNDEEALKFALRANDKGYQGVEAKEIIDKICPVEEPVPAFNLTTQIVSVPTTSSATKSPAFESKPTSYTKTKKAGKAKTNSEKQQPTERPQEATLRTDSKVVRTDSPVVRTDSKVVGTDSKVNAVSTTVKPDEAGHLASAIKTDDDDDGDDRVLQEMIKKQQKKEKDANWKASVSANAPKSKPVVQKVTGQLKTQPASQTLCGPNQFANYLYLLACEICYIKQGEGLPAYNYRFKPHFCTKNILLIKKSEKCDWMKIRPYPHKATNYAGKFRLCQQFQDGERCKLGEPHCSFGHYQEEMVLWNYDRNEQFSISGFIKDMSEGGVNEYRRSSSRESTPSRCSSSLMSIGANSAFSSQQSLASVGSKMSSNRDASGNNAKSSAQASGSNLVNMNAQFGSRSSVGSSYSQASQRSPRKPPSTSNTQWGKNNAPVSNLQKTSTEFGSRTSVMSTSSQVSQKPAQHASSPVKQTPQQNVTPLLSINVDPVRQETKASGARPDFPLNEREYDWDFLCLAPQCIIKINAIYFLRKADPHQCERNTLFVRLKQIDRWLLIRERSEGNIYKGPNQIMLCDHLTGRRLGPCPRDMSCIYPHNGPEQILWSLEKDGKFNVGEFIRCYGTQTYALTVRGLTEKYGTSFHFLCYECFILSPPRVNLERQNGQTILCKLGHQWSTSRIMCYINPNGLLILIAKRRLTHKGAFYKMCKFMRYCYRFKTVGCIFAHDPLEKEVWLLEQSISRSQYDIVLQIRAIEDELRLLEEQSVRQQSQQAQQSEQVQQAQQSTSAPTWPIRTDVKQSTTGVGAPVGGVGSVNEAGSKTKRDQIPFTIIHACGACWQHGRLMKQQGEAEHCGASHLWLSNRVCLKMPEKMVIRQIEKPVYERVSTVRQCEHKKCMKKVCHYAHGSAELEVWTWQKKHKVYNLDNLVELSRQKSPEAVQQNVSPPASSATKGASIVAALLSNESSYYCPYCSFSCPKKILWDRHCSSADHNFNVSTDKDRQWNYRQPPWSRSGEKYALCQKHKNGKKCRYSTVADQQNLCPQAHSEEELEEWNERLEWRTKKRAFAQSDVCSFMDAVIKEYEKASCKPDVMAPDLDGVVITVDEDLNTYLSDKLASHTWTFHVNAEENMKLVQVALLYPSDRQHFSIIGRDLDDNCQISLADVLEDPQDANHHVVIVAFNAKMFGSFHQSLVFDFGTRPVIVKKLRVEVGRKEAHDKIYHYRQQLSLDRWSHENRELVTCQQYDTFEQFLLNKYMAVTSASEVVTYDAVITDLNHNNYVHKMHKMLNIEELELHKLVASYNLRTTIELVDKIEEGSYVFAQQNTLFARVPLNAELNEDHDAGKVVLRYVNYVFLAPQNAVNKKVYEAEIVSRERFDYEGRGREYLYLWLSETCCKEMGLRADDTKEVEVQFQIDRGAFCRMHYALDQLISTELVFPNLTRQTTQNAELVQLDAKAHGLNKEQWKIVTHVLKKRSVRPPPLIVYGPFGTGKTETIAQSCMILLQDVPDVKILVCTHVNWSADQYILRHLDDFVTRTPSIIMLRVYDTKRRINTVDERARKYCLLDGNQFKLPTLEQLGGANIVVTTTNMAAVICHIGYKQFTHIFVDEAGQALECETAMPLTLACNDVACVVLAGDYLQTSERVYSRIAREQGMDRSLLERLFNYYEEHGGQAKFVNTTLRVSLKWNYRSKAGIVKFLSSVFYGHPDFLIAKYHEPEIPFIPTMAFFTNKGREIQDKENTSPHNWAEANEVVTRVKDLLISWPEAWGEYDPTQVCVVTPYAAQVQIIRYLLRLERLSKVNVVNVHAVPGHEYRAVFISIVRTRHLVVMEPCLNANVAVEDMRDFGFLSDRKLVNTAMTRAKSFVGVFGDPVVMCAVGANNNVWRTYLKHCGNYRSIHPPSVTYDSVKEEVMNLNNHGILAAEFDEDTTNIPHHQDIKYAQMLEPSLPPVRQQQLPVQDIPPMPKTPEVDSGIPLSSSPRSESSQKTEEEALPSFGSETTHDLNPERILQQFAEEVRRRQPAVNGQGDAARADSIQFTVIAGHAVMKLEAVSSYPGVRESDGMFTGEYMAQLMDAMAPGHYVQCTLKTDGVRFYAEYTDGVLQHRIEFGNSDDCGAAFTGDKVVVQSQVEQLGRPTTTYGKVVYVSERRHAIHHRPILAAVGQSTGIFLPLDRDLPPIYNVITKDRLKQSQNNHVCVYTFTRAGDITFHHYEKVEPRDTGKKVFILRMLRFEPTLQAPVAVVIGVLPAGTTLNTCMDLINRTYDVKRKFKPEVDAHVTATFGPTFKTPISSNSLDLRSNFTFTVMKDSTDLVQTAYSISALPDGFTLGVHVPDTTNIVLNDDVVDREAMSRGVNYYHPKYRNIPMLPTRINDLCSLKVGAERPALSILITTNRNGRITDWKVTTTVVKVTRNFNYKEIQDIMDDTMQTNDETTQMFENLLVVTDVWRLERLGRGAVNKKTQVTGASMAWTIVEEMNIAANVRAAMYLTIHYYDCGLILRQSNPTGSAMEAWKSTHSSAALNCMALRRHFLPTAGVCRCEGDCHCVGPQNVQNMTVRADVWCKILDKAARFDTDSVEELLHSAENHPLTLLAQHELQQLEPAEQYGVPVINQNTHHNATNRHIYTTFTQPLSQYASLVVQRMILSALNHLSGSYGNDLTSLMKILPTLNDRLDKARSHYKLARSVQYAQHLSGVSLPTCLVITAASPKQLLFLPMELAMNGAEELAIDPQLDLSVLGPSTTDILNGRVYVIWRTRIYDLEMRVASNQNTNIELNAHRLVIQVPAPSWKSLISESSERLCEIVGRVRSSVKMTSSDQNADVCGAGHKHYVNIKMTFERGQIIQCQLSASVQRGLLRPQLQLLSLSDRFDICVEHRANPAFCFLQSDSYHSSDKDLDTYQRSWQSILELEALEESLEDPVIILGCNVKWQTQGEEVFGVLQLPVTFCRTSKLFMALSTDVGEETLGYVCARYKNVELTSESSLLPVLPFTWVGHCRVVSVALAGRRRLVSVKLQLTHSALPLPAKLANSASDIPCTLEIMMKSMASVVKQRAVKELSSAPDLIQNIALNKKSALVDLPDCLVCKPPQEKIGDMPLPTEEAQLRLLRSLHKPLVLATGAPGSGKTLMSVMIAGHLVTMSGTVLLTGASSSTLELFSRFLQLANVQNVVRVYPSEIVRFDYPVPGEVPAQRPVDERRPYALHHLIRTDGSQEANSIKEYDRKFAMNQFNDSDTEIFKQLVLEASVKCLQKANIIISTCLECGGEYMKEFLNRGGVISRVIVDDANMCQEPELLIPLVTFAPCQVVIFGDPAQLGPVVKSTAAANLGLAVSWLERCMKDDCIRLTHLYTQSKVLGLLSHQLFYPPHVAAWPYARRLTDVPSDIWPNKQQCYFLDHEEPALTVPGDRGRASMVNTQEAAFVVRALLVLIRRLPTDTAAVLCATREQCTYIRSLLDKSQRHGNELSRVEVLVTRDAHGRTWPYTLVSMVVSHLEPDGCLTLPNHSSDLSDDSVINLILTRANKGMMIFGNSSVLKKYHRWNKIILQYENDNVVTEAKAFLDRFPII